MFLSSVHFSGLDDQFSAIHIGSVFLEFSMYIWKYFSIKYLNYLNI